MAFSLTAVLEYLDTLPGHEVMAQVDQLYGPTDTRGIFNSNFLPQEDLAFLGYTGFRQILISLYETNPSFVEQNRQELYSLTQKLKEKHNG